MKLIKKIEKKNNSKIIYIRDLETNIKTRILMIFLNKFIISINDNERLRYILEQNYDKKLMLIIRSYGGYVSSSDSMLTLLDSHKPKKQAYIPNYAMSAATLLALACDDIFMNNYAALGPTDPQINLFDEDIRYKTLQDIIKNKNIDKIKDELLISYYENKILYDNGIKYINNYLYKHKKNNASIAKIKNWVNKLSHGNIPHHTEFTPNLLNEIITINCDIPNDIKNIYKQANNIFNY
jgi:hypothetical protein